ncbi:MAG: cytochrome c3 family protein [Candidatus Neomarinimicrobiota bacterium]
MCYSLLIALLLTSMGPADARPDAQQTPDRIIFSHILHIKDLGLECGQCHEGVATSIQLTHALLPVMDQCLACHDGDTAPQECAVCHTQPDDPTTYTWQPTAGLLFPHQPHIESATACNHCHPGVAVAEALAPRTPPKMGLCMSCHSTPLTDAGCYNCHASLKDKLPASHDTDWAKTHGLFIHSSTDNDCATCHQQTDCEICHAQAQLEKKVHPANYEFLHAGEFLGFEKECRTCHAMPQECMGCHLAKMIMPLSHNSIQWVNETIGGFHIQEALDKPDYCLACHEPASDITCQKCHGKK